MWQILVTRQPSKPGSGSDSIGVYREAEETLIETGDGFGVAMVTVGAVPSFLTISVLIHSQQQSLDVWKEARHHYW